MAYHYIVTAQKPTAVTACVTGNLTAPGDLNLLVAKASRLELYLVTPEGLRPLKEVGLYGVVAKMKLFRPPDEDKDLVFILTAQYNIMMLEWRREGDDELCVVTRAHGNIAEQICKPAENGMLVAIDPQARAIALRIYDGTLKVINLEKDSMELKAYSLRLAELNVYDMEFLHGTAFPTIILVYQDSNGRHIKTYELNLKEKDFFMKHSWKQDNVDMEASILIPVPSPLGGAIVIGQESMVYHDGQAYVAVVPPSLRAPVACYCRVDARGRRYLLGDVAGRLHMLLLELAGDAVRDLKVEPLGEVPVPECMTYLDNGVVFVGSRLGDSALVRLVAARDDAGQYVQHMESFTNLAPIVDMCVVDLERQGQNQLVTCSGGFKSGSLRVVRSGIGIQEQASMDLPGIKGMWPLTLAADDGYDDEEDGDTEGARPRRHDALVLAFVGQTRVLALSGEEVEETDIEGFAGDRQTLYAANVRGGLLQVTAAGAALAVRGGAGGGGSWRRGDAWAAPVPLALAAGRGGRLVAAAGARLFVLRLEGGRLQLEAEATLAQEVACLDLGPGRDAPLLAVGLWTDISVRVLALPGLRALHEEPLPGEIIPRSLLLAELERQCYLLCALGDGSMYYFLLDPATGELSSRKKVTLGTQPTVLRSFRSLSTTNIFACSDRPTVIFSSNQKLVFTNVNLKEVTHMCTLNAAAYPDSLALATATSVTIGTIDEIQKLHIRSVPLGTSPRRLAHQPASQTFGVLTQDVAGAGTGAGAAGADADASSLLLLDHHTFELLHAQPLAPTEFGLSLLSCRLGDEPQPFYVVGTAFISPEEAEPKSGRILLYQWTDGKLLQVAEKDIKAACFTLAEFNGKLVAGLNSTVRLFEWTSDKELRLECSFFNNVLAVYTKTKGDFVLIGDLMRSLMLIQYKHMEGSFEEIARDCMPYWTTAVEILDDDTFLGAESNCTLFVCQKDSSSANDHERHELMPLGHIHLGDMVNVIRHGSLVPPLGETAAPAVRPVMLATVNGAIYLMVQLEQAMFELLSSLQSRLAQTIKSVGKIPHELWRAAQGGPQCEFDGFIDGDLIECFLDLAPAVQAEVVAGVQITDADSTVRDAKVDDISKIVEDFSRLH